MVPSSFEEFNSGAPTEAFDRFRVRIVLVRARNPNNIGAVARAMHDFGFSDLRLVSEYTVPFESARSAVDASAVLNAAVQTSCLADALTGCSLVVGTTAVGERILHHPLLVLEQAAVRVRAETSSAFASGSVAILFGSEKTGLSNEELSHCDLLLTIPMHAHAGQRHASMNLGQAVAVCLWELVRMGTAPASAVREMAEADDLERIFTMLSDVLEAADYTRRHAATSDAPHIRRLVHRMSLESQDVPAWLGMLRQILWKLVRQKADEPNRPEEQRPE